MNLIAVAPVWIVVVLGCAMVAAAIEDAARLRISNITSLIVIASAILAALLTGLSWALWQNLVVFLIILTLGTAAFSAGWLGGGDVKLFAAVGLWFDFRSALAFTTLVFLAGGVVALGYLLIGPLRSGTRKTRQVPYGIAIAVGALAVIFLAQQTQSARERAFSTLVSSHSP